MNELRERSVTARKILWALYGGFALAGCYIILMFATGQTFGQKCSAVWKDGSPEWQSCVHNLVNR